MTYSIWLEPSANDKRYLQKIIRSLARQHRAPQFQPHITLYSGVPSIKLAKNAVHDCKCVSKIQVVGGKLRHSDYLWKTLYLEIKPSSRLTALNQVLRARLQKSTKYRFCPHVSLIYKKMPTGKKRQIVKELRIKRTLEFDKISIIHSSKTVRNWKVLAKISLK